MNLDTTTGWVDGITRMPSENHNERPVGVKPEVIIVHAISLPPGSYGGSEVDALFCNQLNCDAHPFFDKLRDLQVSAHFLIRRNGTVVQFVPTHLRAWHAGESFCQGRSNVNDFSIGIELEGCDEDQFEDSQYDSLNQLIELICTAYPSVNRQSIYGHSDIAPGRKTDPGPHFDWSRTR